MPTFEEIARDLAAVTARLQQNPSIVFMLGSEFDRLLRIQLVLSLAATLAAKRAALGVGA
jgi:hypothetical protein